MATRSLCQRALVLVLVTACSGKISLPEHDGASLAPDAGHTGSGGSATLDCSAPNVGAAPLKRLTREQYDNTVRDLVAVVGHPSAGLTADEKIAAFYSNIVSPVSRLVVEQYSAVAESIASRAVTNLDALVGCDRALSSDATCAREFIERFGARVFRRPLNEGEAARYEQLFTTYGADFAEGIRVVVTALLQSPHFLYHLELGPVTPESPGAVALGGYELASRLSYALWNTMPDQALFDAAADGSLLTAEGLRVQAERLLDDARAEDAIASFHVQWLGLEALPDIQKDPDLFPAFDEALRAAMANETVRFASYVLRRGDGRLETLLTAPFSVIDAPLAALYGVAPASDPNEPVLLNAAERAGFLTQAAFLATHAHSNQTSPVHRGLAVRKNLLCTTLPDPPANVNNNPPDPDPGATTRERFAEHTSEASCAGCHTLIDPVGFGFEQYDAIGRYRTHENELEIDATGELVNGGDTSGTFVGAVELAKKLATSDKVRDCVARQWFRFSLGRTESDADACTLQRVAVEFGASDYDIRQLLFAIVTSDAFRYRRGGSE